MADLRLEGAVEIDRIDVRYASPDDLAQLTDLYNHYILTTPITFDLEPVSVEQRRIWLEQFSETGRHRLLVAVQDGSILGFAGSHEYRDRAAYDSTIETTIYCHPDATGRGIGSLLYTRLFEAIAGEDIHMAIAGITLPNAASVAIHERFGFKPVGVTHAVGRKFGHYWDVGWFEKTLP
jgi:phosphinothricin acetyltransferase